MLISIFNYRCNGPIELTKRYIRFILQKLLDIAVDVAGNGARSCSVWFLITPCFLIEVLILISRNRLQVLRYWNVPKAYIKSISPHDGQRNGSFAKLPNPNAGPAHYTTASEVATREFVSRKNTMVLYAPIKKSIAARCTTGACASNLRMVVRSNESCWCRMHYRGESSW